MIREVIYNNLGIQLPTSKPLWSYKEGLNFSQVNKEPIEKAMRAYLFDIMHINKNIVDLDGNILVPNVPHKIDLITNKIIFNRNRYKLIAHHYANPIKWYHIGLIHQMECAQNFNCYLGNGQPWNKKTTIVPKGRGPFTSFEAAAHDAIVYDNLNEQYDWSIGSTLYILEGFNGYGYSRYRGINSPYLFSGSNLYTSGYYIADSVYSPKAVSKQIGIALILKVLLEKINQ